MKKLFLIIVGAAMFSICDNPFQKKAADHSDTFTGSNDDKNSKFIIPLDSKSLICDIENNEIHQLGSFFSIQVSANDLAPYGRDTQCSFYTQTSIG
jgi:hypothetical protein